MVAELNKEVHHNETIYLCITRGHYVFVKHMHNYLGFVRGYYCKGCNRIVKSLHRHFCDFELCKHYKCRCDSVEGVTNFVECEYCGRKVRMRECYEDHLRGNASPMYPMKNVCESAMVCRYCKKDLAACEGVFMRDKEGDCINAYQIYSSKKARKHVCFQAKCYTCNCKYDIRAQHRCYVRSVSKSEMIKMPEKTENLFITILKPEPMLTPLTVVNSTHPIVVFYNLPTRKQMESIDRSRSWMKTVLKN